jgi:hypothetical protein
MIALVFAFSTLCAEPTPLEIDGSVKKKTSDKNIRLVHAEIPTDTSDLAQIRYRILQAMLTTRGRIWTYEGEGDGFFLARFDYRGNSTLMRIEYNEQLVQL